MLHVLVFSDAGCGMPDLVRRDFTPMQMGRKTGYIALSREVPFFPVVYDAAFKKPMQAVLCRSFTDLPVGFQLPVPADLGKKSQLLDRAGVRVRCDQIKPVRAKQGFSRRFGIPAAFRIIGCENLVGRSVLFQNIPGFPKQRTVKTAHFDAVGLQYLFHLRIAFYGPGFIAAVPVNTMNSVVSCQFRKDGYWIAGMDLQVSVQLLIE